MDLATSRPVHELTLGDVSRSNALRFGQRTAIRQGALTLSFADVEDTVSRLAGALAARGVGPGDCVVWLGLGSWRIFASLLACARLGACLAPVNWRWQQEETGHAIRSVGARLVLDTTELDTGAALRKGFTDEGVTWLGVDDAGWQGLVSAGEPRVDDADDVREALPALVIFTAAFGGRPLGAQLSHRGLLTEAMLLAARDQLRVGDGYLASGPLFHIGTLQYVLAYWVAGGRTVFLPRFEAASVVEAISRDRLNGAYLMPASIPELVAAADATHADLTSLRTPALDGDAIHRRWTQLTSRPVGASGSIGTSTGYGQTEVTGLVSAVALGDGAASGSGGWPFAAAVVRIVHPGTANEVAPGEVGEIVVRGPLVMTGYRNAERASKERLVSGWHRTTDLGRWELDGSVSFVGPAALVVKTGGENVYPAEVEQMLAEHPDVAAACVVGLPDPKWGEQVAAMVAPKQGSQAPLDVAALERYARERMAGYKRPRRWLLVAELPRQGASVDRAAVRQALLDSAQNTAGTAS